MMGTLSSGWGEDKRTLPAPYEVVVMAGVLIMTPVVYCSRDGGEGATNETTCTS